MNWIESARRDVRHAWRMIARMPVLATVVVLSLGVGIGVNVVIFSWIQAVVFQPIPGVADAASFNLVEPRTETGMNPGTSWLEYRDLRERLQTFRDLLAFRMTPLYVGEPGQVERAYGLLVSGNYFSALGLRPALGRFFRPDEVAQPGGEPVAVISHEYWQSHFAGAPTAVGQVVRVNSRDAHDRRRRAAGIPGHGAAAEVRSVAAGHDGAGAAQRIARAGRAQRARLHRHGPASAGDDARAGAERCGRGDAPVVAGVSGHERDHAGRGAAVLAVLARPAALPGDGARVSAGHHAAAAGRGLRQHGEPHAGAGERAAAGDGHAAGARRRALAHREPAARGEHDARAHRRRRLASRSASGERGRSPRCR